MSSLQFEMGLFRRFILQIIASYFVQLIRSSHHHELVPFLGERIPLAHWNRTQENLYYWAEHGRWTLHNITIIDDISLYRPCPVYYGPKNPCSWVLDGNALKYVWEIKSRKHDRYENILSPFDYTVMCEIMENRGNILMVGDSVHHLHYLSFQNLFYVNEGIRTCPEERDTLPNCHNLSLYYVRNDFLSTINSAVIDETKGSSSQQYPWIDLIDEKNISLMIINRGAHYKPDEELIADINSTLHFIFSRHPNMSVVWRNTPHGHADYQRFIFAPPLEDDPNLPENAPYNYGRFKKQNALVQEFLAMHYPFVLVLDVFLPTVLRPDSHYDAIHVCVPGPVDLWTTLLYNAFIRLFPGVREGFTTKETSESERLQ